MERSEDDGRSAPAPARAEPDGGIDRFGNEFADGLPYARGRILRDTSDDLRKLRTAWGHVAAHLAEGGPAAVYNLSGLERSLPWRDGDTPLYDDELAPAVFGERLRELALEHLGGDPERHDVLLCNRVTAALFTAQMVMARPGTIVVGVSARYSHPVIARGARRVGAEFVDCRGAEAFGRWLPSAPPVSLVVLTRLSVTYELLPADELDEVASLARTHELPLLIDDAGGARVGPILAGQPKMLELGAQAGATGLDKYGTSGPRLGLAGGDRELIGQMRARAWEYGLEARPMLFPAAVASLESYDPQRVHASAALTAAFGDVLKERIGGERVFEAPGTVQIGGEEILELALDAAPESGPAAIVPYEATACLAMLLLRDYGILTVHFAGIPPGNGGLLVKFLSPANIERLGGPDVFAEAIEASIGRLSEFVHRPEEVSRLLYGPGPAVARPADRVR